MAPQVQALAQSESKARFFARLGLDPTNRLHKRVYALMKMESAEGRRRLLEGQSRSTAQIHEAAWTREVARIYAEARPETRAVYDFGQDTDTGGEPDNWIIRWLLWHVFRYRDYRNKNRPPRPPNAPSESSSSDDEQDPSPRRKLSRQTGTYSNGKGTASSQTDSRGSASTSQYWDPVREQWLG